MSRCEHNEIITKFCLHEACTWREAAGCDTCFRKYHTHSSDILPLDKLEEINAKLLAKTDTKFKVRPFQEAIYNYFTIMKSQLSSSVDEISRIIGNNLSYPYLSQQDQLPVHKKIKHREFKKINKKQLKSYHDFAQSLNSETYQNQQKHLYLAEVNKTLQMFKKIDESLKAYRSAIFPLNTSFNIDKTFYEKIFEIGNCIKETQKQSNEGTSTKGSEKNKYESNFLKPIEDKKSQKERKISFDVGLANNEVNRFHEKFKIATNYDDKEKEINEKKKKLMEMLEGQKKTESTMQPIRIQIKGPSQHAEKTPDRSKNQSIEKDSINSQEKSQNNSKERKKPNPLQVSGSLRKQLEFNSEKKEELSKEDAAMKVLSDLIDKGLNIPQMIVHTIIPAGEEKLKLYQHSRDVKEQKITVPVKKFDEAEEVSSPLLKKRKTKGGGGGLKLFQVATDKDGELEKIEEEKTPVKEEKKEEESMVLKEKEADSLALLLESLRMPAQKAIPLLEAAVKYAENNLSATQYLSFLYLEVGKPKKCLDLCNSMLEQLEDSAQAEKLSVHINNNKAAALNVLGRYSEAITILEKCLLYLKKDIFYKNLADAYFSIGIYQKAVFNYERAIRMNPEMDQCYYNLAVCLFTHGDFNESKLNIQKALKINRNAPEYGELYKEVSIKASN